MIACFIKYFVLQVSVAPDEAIKGDWMMNYNQLIILLYRLYHKIENTYIQQKKKKFEIFRKSVGCLSLKKNSKFEIRNSKLEIRKKFETRNSKFEKKNRIPGG